jgi:hypothetical protein
MKKYYLMFILLFFVSCATPTPPGQLTDSDFLIKQVSIGSPIDEVHSNLLTGLRRCGGVSPELFFVTQYGAPECMPRAKNGSIICDIYLTLKQSGRTQWVLGRIDLVPQGETTNATLRVQTYVANNQKTLDAWIIFLSGKAASSCPQ